MTMQQWTCDFFLSVGPKHWSQFKDKWKGYSSPRINLHGNMNAISKYWSIISLLDFVICYVSVLKCPTWFQSDGDPNP